MNPSIRPLSTLMLSFWPTETTVYLFNLFPTATFWIPSCMEVLPPTETARPLAHSTYLSVPLSTVPTYIREFTSSSKWPRWRKAFWKSSPCFLYRTMGACPASRPFSSNKCFLVTLHTFAMWCALLIRCCPCTQTFLHDLLLTLTLQTSFLPQSFHDVFPHKACSCLLAPIPPRVNGDPANDWIPQLCFILQCTWQVTLLMQLFEVFFQDLG